MTVTYTFYTDTYKGFLDETSFNNSLPTALDRIEMLVGEVDNPSTKTQKAVCYLIDLINLTKNESDYQSETEGDYSYTKSEYSKKKSYLYENAISLLKYEGYKFKVCLR